MEIHFSPELQSNLDKAAKSIGCGTEEFVQKIVAGYIAGEKTLSTDDHQKRRAAADAIIALQKQVKPDPEGWTIRDYINYGRQ